MAFFPGNQLLLILIKDDHKLVSFNASQHAFTRTAARVQTFSLWNRLFSKELSHVGNSKPKALPAQGSSSRNSSPSWQFICFHHLLFFLMHRLSLLSPFCTCLFPFFIQVLPPFYTRDLPQATDKSFCPQTASELPSPSPPFTPSPHTSHLFSPFLHPPLSFPSFIFSFFSNFSYSFSSPFLSISPSLSTSAIFPYVFSSLFFFSISLTLSPLRPSYPFPPLSPSSQFPSSLSLIRLLLLFILLIHLPLLPLLHLPLLFLFLPYSFSSSSYLSISPAFSLSSCSLLLTANKQTPLSSVITRTSAKNCRPSCYPNASSFSSSAPSSCLSRCYTPHVKSHYHSV